MAPIIDDPIEAIYSIIALLMIICIYSTFKTMNEKRKIIESRKNATHATTAPADDETKSSLPRYESPPPPPEMPIKHNGARWTDEDMLDFGADCVKMYRSKGHIKPKAKNLAVWILVRAEGARNAVKKSFS